MPKSLTTPRAECDENIVRVPSRFLWDRGAATRNGRSINCGQTGLGGERKFVLEVVLGHVSDGFGQQQARPISWPVPPRQRTSRRTASHARRRTRGRNQPRRRKPPAP